MAGWQWTVHTGLHGTISAPDSMNSPKTPKDPERPVALERAMGTYRRRSGWAELDALLLVASRIPGGASLILDEFLDRAVAGRSENPARLMPSLHLAEVLLEADRPTEALAHLDDCLEAWGSSARPIFLATRAATRCGDFDEAKRRLLQHRALNKPEAHLHLEAEFVLRFNHPVDAERLGRHLLAHPGAKAEGPLLAAQLATRVDSEHLAARALAALAQSGRYFSLPKRQGERLEKMVRRRFLRLLEERPP